MALQPPPRATHRPTNADLREVRRLRGGSSARWLLFSATLLTPLTLVGYLLDSYYYSQPCPFGALCQLDTLPPLLQVCGIMISFLLLWVLLYVFGSSALDGPKAPPPGTLARLVYEMSRFEPVRWLLVLYGAAALILGLLAIAQRRPDPAGYTLTAIVVFVGFCALLYGPPRPVVELTPQEEAALADAVRPGNVLRSLPPFRYLHKRTTAHPADTTQNGGTQP
ncbi:MAG: hypothetical protein ACXVCO_19320 [Ktedonobacterales bacterium]